MLNNFKFDQVYLSCRETDMRKSINGLAVIIREGFDLDPFVNAIFVFCNKGKNKVKILRWDRNGFWLYYKRLEKGRFKWPAYHDENTAKITEYQLRCLLDGLSLEQSILLKNLPEVKERKLI